MTLIVEDGTMPAGANSYASLVTLKAYASLRGIDLGTVDSTIEVWAIKAIDYLESKRNDFQGNKLTNTQSLQFPRFNVFVDGFDYTSLIPGILVNAQCQLVMELKNGVDIMPTITDPAIKSEKIGPIQTDYAVNPGDYFMPELSAVDALLQPLFKNGNAGYTIKTMRV